jgi:pyruvate/2-oxoglutarate/acetoin dehydrogenase E1 component
MTLAGRISYEIQARYFDYVDSPIATVSGLDVPPPVSRKLEAAVLPSVEGIKAQMRRAANRKL